MTVGRTSEAREMLLASASELIHARGYQGVGVQELCDHAGVKKGSFYHFFRSKRELALQMLDQQWAQMRTGVLDPAFASDVPPLDRLRRFFDGMSDSLSDSKTPEGVLSGCPFCNLTLEMGATDDTIRRRLDEIFREWSSYFEDAVREAVELGDLPQVDTRKTAETLLALMSGAVLLAKARNDATAAEEIIEYALDVLLTPVRI